MSAYPPGLWRGRLPSRFASHREQRRPTPQPSLSHIRRRGLPIKVTTCYFDRGGAVFPSSVQLAADALRRVLRLLARQPRPARCGMTLLRHRQLSIKIILCYFDHWLPSGSEASAKCTFTKLRRYTLFRRGNCAEFRQQAIHTPSLPVRCNQGVAMIP